MVDVEHPAYHGDIQRGKPSRATVGTTDYAIDRETGSIPDEEFADESAAVEAMDQLASTYGVTYTDDGEIENDSTPETPDSGGEDTAADDSEDAEGGDSTGNDGDESLTQDELQALDRDELRERCRANDAVDVEAINLNQTGEMVAALLRAQTESVDGEGE